MTKIVHAQMRAASARLDLPEDTPEEVAGRIVRTVRTELSRLLVDMGLAPKRLGPNRKEVSPVADKKKR
jgi:hypothetical protein